MPVRVVVMTASETVTQPRTYGNWQQPRSPGLWGLGRAATYLMLGGCILSVTIMMVSGSVLRGIVSFAVVGVVVLLMLLRDKHGRNGFSRIATRAAWWTSKAKGANLYRSGPLSRTPWGTAQLPGLAAGLMLTEHLDSYGRPFALIHCPSAKTYSVVLSAQPDGEALVDPHEVDLWVARWGQWLANLADEPGLEAAAVTVETAPDSGTRLRTEVAANLDPDAPPLAKQMLDEIVDRYPRGTAATTAFITLTFNQDVSAGSRDAAEVGRDLAARLPGLVMGLKGTGAGAVEPVSSAHLCEVVRTAYDPDAARLIETAHAEGDDLDLRWPQAGPTAHEAHWDYLVHDSGLSVTWTMSNAPRGNVQSSVLARLLQSHPDITRKRVALLYRPIEPARAAAIVDADVRTSEFRVSASKKPTARDTAAVRAARATASEEASGAGLVEFAVIVTATVTNPNGLKQARAAVDSMSSAARLRLRPSFGAQDSAFAFSLPLGLIPSKHVRLPSELTEGL